jgi:hypothetical protein
MRGAKGKIWWFIDEGGELFDFGGMVFHKI